MHFILKLQKSLYPAFKYMFIGEPGGSIEAGSLIGLQAGPLIEAGGSDTVVLIEAGGFY